MSASSCRWISSAIRTIASSLADEHTTRFFLVSNTMKGHGAIITPRGLAM